jgi:hypothetical protein
MHGGCHSMNKPSSLTERITMRFLASLALACAVLCCGCSAATAIPDAAIPDSGVVQASPRGIVGEVCPPALAAKGYC